jgi:hypothetical protein
MISQMTESNPAAPETESSHDPSLEALRTILFDQYRQKIAELEAELDELEQRVTDEETLTTIIAPVLSDAIRRKIRDARDEMIEALYPIIGETVVRAVSEAIRDLARNVDAQMRRTLSPRGVWRRLRARVSGVSGAEMALRQTLPFEVTEVFLVHRETGLLLWYVSRDSDASFDSDLISGMLTAIGDFVQEAFGRGEEGQLDEIQYGERRILIEAARYAYLAVVVDGVEPPGFRAEMRQQIIEIDNEYEPVLRDYEGDNTPLAPVESPLRSLGDEVDQKELSPVQKRVLFALFGLMLACVVMIGLGGRWAWRATRPAPAATDTPTITATATAIVTSTATSIATSTPVPTETPTPTATATPIPTTAPTSTAISVPSPVLGVMTGNSWAREGPSPTSPRTGLILEQGQPVEILAVFDDWCQVRWSARGQPEVSGWVSLRWIGTVTVIPDRLITPTAVP